MALKKLTIKDKKIFDKFLVMRRHELSVYAFENIYIWKPFFNIFWDIIEESLCLFFKDAVGCFLYLPPLSYRMPPKVIQKVYLIMDSYNRNPSVSRIENIESEDLQWYQDLGYNCTEKFPEYLCKRSQMVDLSGNQFKSKRASVNYFLKHYSFEWLPFSINDKDECLQLYSDWMFQRSNKSSDTVYRGMLRDGLSCLKLLLNSYRHLDITGKVIRIGGKIKAFSFGFKLTPDTFCIAYEIADLSIKGVSQYIFRRFSEELGPYTYINIMDDSGLYNLRKVKLSYHPVRIIRSYVATRK